VFKNPDCPKSDELSPFSGIAFVDGEILVRLEEVPDEFLPQDQEETETDPEREEKAAEESDEDTSYAAEVDADGQPIPEKKELPKVRNPLFDAWTQEEASCQILRTIRRVKRDGEGEGEEADTTTSTHKKLPEGVMPTGEAGVNTTDIWMASKSCGPIGEYKSRV